MNVKVRSIALIKMLLGRAEMDLDLAGGTTIDGLLARLTEIGGEKLAPYVAVPKEQSAHAPLRVLVNGRDITVLAGRQTVLKDGDDVLIFTPIAGG
jgi:molybdopterin converting factor small subunit